MTVAAPHADPLKSIASPARTSGVPDGNDASVTATVPVAEVYVQVESASTLLEPEPSHATAASAPTTPHVHPRAPSPRGRIPNLSLPACAHPCGRDSASPYMPLRIVSTATKPHSAHAFGTGKGMLYVLAVERECRAVTAPPATKPLQDRPCRHTSSASAGASSGKTLLNLYLSLRSSGRGDSSHCTGGTARGRRAVWFANTLLGLKRPDRGGE